jgi:hypothetical protein
MRKWWTLPLVMLVCAWAIFPAVAQSNESTVAQESEPTDVELVSAGRQAVANGKYETALKQYRLLVERHPEDPTLLYNLGTVYARRNDRGRAVWRYLQALERDPRDAATRRNLKILAPNLFEQIAVTPLPPLNFLYQRLTAAEWSMLAGLLSLSLLAGGCLFFALPRGRMLRAAIKPLLALLALATFLAYMPASIRYYESEVLRRGVIVEDDTVARTGPSENQIETFSLPAGTVVKVLEEHEGSWLKISYAGGRIGFVPSTSIAEL